MIFTDECPLMKCVPCDSNIYLRDSYGCQTCQCGGNQPIKFSVLPNFFMSLASASSENLAGGGGGGRGLVNSLKAVILSSLSFKISISRCILFF